MAKGQASVSFLEQLSYLLLIDTQGRWAGIYVTIFVGVITGVCELVLSDSSTNDAVVAMMITMFFTALIFFGIYSFTRSRATVRKTPDLKKTLWIGSGTCGVAVALSISSLTYQTRILNQEFASAFDANDLARIAAVAGEAENVSSRLHKALVRRSEQTFVAATKQPSSWKGVLVYLGTVTAPIPQGPTFVVKQSAGTTTIAWGSKIVGGSFDISDLSGDGFAPGGHGIGNDPPALINVLVKGGRQTLDGFEWRNVTFVGTRISYKGGTVKLEGVRFVKCTFDLPPDPRGARLAQYVALTLPNLDLGSSAAS
jgi:hypothetical protein